MTERCQKKFTEKFDNQNYIICFGIITISLVVLYYYRFHFVTLAFSYVLGCVACYYGLNSSVLHNYLCKLQCHFFGETPEDVKTEKTKGCVTCGSKQCNRHDDSITTEPWVGLQIHKQLDQAIEDFYNTILEQFVNSWYSKITLQPFFVDELKHQLRYASACLLHRAIKINYSRFITERLLPCALRHYTLCSDRPSDAMLITKLAVHPAAANRNAELKYLRCITNAVMPYLLKNHDIQNSVFRVLIREIFAGWVLLSLTDVLSDPYILNTLIILATGDETMAKLPTTPNYKVEFLETFVRQTESLYAQRCKLFKLDLDLVINDQEYFYSFMQYMKNTSHLHLLQFYKDIKLFQTKILNPELSESEKASLHSEACDIYSLYISEHSAYRVPLHATLAQELYELLQCKDSIKRLQTSRALYQAAHQSHAVLEKIMLPRFLHSEEFYKLLLGSRIPAGYQKNLIKKPQERLINTAIKLGNKLRGALRTQAIEGQILDCYTNMDELEPNDNIDILKYLESITAEESLDGNDLTKYKVVLTNVEIVMQAPPRRGHVRVFEVGVHCADTLLYRTLRRTEHDFHLLRSKLHEFHGDALLHDLPLPSRRDNSPLETIRYKYEDFLQRLLQKSLLQTSELLRLFLTEDGDFSLAVQASTLNANSTDLINIYQSVTHKLRKEKGQHLESFLRNLLVSSDRDRYQALKQGREVEEALEVNEDVETEQTSVRQSNVRDIRNTIFGNNFNTEPDFVVSTGYQDEVVGFTQCLMYLLIKVIRVQSFVSGVIGTVLSYVKSTLDVAVNRYLNILLQNLLSEQRLAHLIRLGHEQLFGKKSSLPRSDVIKHRELARKQLLNSLQNVTLLSSGLKDPVNNAFEIIQDTRLNKQLVYNLLDLCVVELFSELRNEDPHSNEGPKS